MGRKPKYQEFLQTLQEITGITVRELATLLGKQPQNLSAYLKGTKSIDKRALRSALGHYAEWQVVEDQTMLPVDDRIYLTTGPGIYFIYDSAGDCIYIGQGSNLNNEVSQALRVKKLDRSIRRDPSLTKQRYRLIDIAAFVTTYSVESPRVRHNLEALFLRTMINQTHNSKIGNFK